MFGSEVTESVEVTAVVEERSYKVESEISWRPLHFGYEAGASWCGRYLLMTFTGAPTTTIAKVMAATVGQCLADSTGKALQLDLENIAAAAEQAPS